MKQAASKCPAQLRYFGSQEEANERAELRQDRLQHENDPKYSTLQTASVEHILIVTGFISQR